jgi:uncharacterized membrane protein
MSPRVSRSGGWVYVAAFVFPFFGLAYGVLQTAQPEPESRRRGKTCIILGIVSSIVICLGAVFYIVYSVKEGFTFFGS